jgi:hypothetical protein
MRGRSRGARLLGRGGSWPSRLGFCPVPHSQGFAAFGICQSLWIEVECRCLRELQMNRVALLLHRELKADRRRSSWRLREIRFVGTFGCMRCRAGRDPLPAALAAAEPAARIEEAREAGRAGLELDPSFSSTRVRRSMAFSDNPIFLAGRERLYEGMRKAGMPEQ